MDIGKKLITLIMACLVLAACGGESGDDGSRTNPDKGADTKAAPMMEDAGTEAVSSLPARDAPAMAKVRTTRDDAMAQTEHVDGVVSPRQNHIAYRYGLAFSLPTDQIETLMADQATACRMAGPQTCFVVISRVSAHEDGQTLAMLSLRARPDWIGQFMDEVILRAETVGGQVTERWTEAEDLTARIIDTDARLTAQKTLQKRLLTVLEQRNANLRDLLTAEQELARVNATIKSIEGQLANLRLQVSMSAVNISYKSKITPFSPSPANPLGAAVGRFFHNFTVALAVIVTAFALGLPWMLLGGLLLLIWLKLIRPRLRRKPAGGE